MRVLCSTTAGSGHFGPLVPFARACQDAGHEVRVAAPASFAAAVTGAGFAHVPFDDVPADVMGAVFGRLPSLSYEEANRVVMADVFGRLDAQAALPGVTAAIGEWKPDLVLREPCEFASLVAADRAGVAQVQVAIGLDVMLLAVGPFLDAPLRELAAMADLPPERAVDLFTTTPQLSCVPATLDDIGDAEMSTGRGPTARRVFRFRDASTSPSDAALPPSWGDPDDPLVYVSYGSVTAALPHLAPVYAASLEALRDAPMRVLLTTGSAIDPADLGPHPANIRVEPWWPQADVMPHAAAVVGHGGFGTTMLALAAGVPQVVVPLFAADQHINARCVAAAGAGIHLAGGVDAVADLPDALERVTTDPSYRACASEIASEIADLPPTATAVPVLERLASA